MTERKGTNLALVFGGAAGGGGSSDAASAGGPSGDELEDMAEDLGGDMAEGEETDGAPPDFAVHALEAFPDLEEPQIEALYRAIKACHPSV